MREGIRICGFCLLALSALLVCAETPGRAETLTVPGTGACEPIVAELAEAFSKANPAERVIVPPSTGSGGGISAVLKGEAPLARIARPLKEAEMKQGLVPLVFARDAVAFVVGRQVKLTNLSANQLAAIFSGKIDNWKEVGGPAGPIRVVTREPGDSSLTVIQEHLEDFRTLVFSPQAKVVMYDRPTVEILDKYRNTVGFVTMSSRQWSDGGFTPISLDGVAPTRENIIAGKYHLVEHYSFISKKEPAPAAARFLDFVFSAMGRKLIENRGMIAVDRR